VVDREGTNDYVTSGPDGARRKAAFVVLIDEETNAGALALAAALVDHTKATIAGRLAAHINGMVTAVRPLPPEKGKPRDRYVRYPIGVLKRPNGAPLAEGFVLDHAISATGDAAIAEAIKAFK
jgi:C-terminal processing protease CtpA/Prc